MSEHTKEPWKASGFAIYADNMMIGQLGISSDRIVSANECEANARRIVACVNHCAGVQTEKLEASPFSYLDMLNHSIKIREQRDELLAALKKIAQGPWPYFVDSEEAKCKFDEEIANDAIAKAEAAL